MYLIGHALKNIVRNKGWYLLIGTVLIVSFMSVTVSAMIHFTTTAVIDDYSDRFGASVYFTPDLRKLLTLTKPDENGMYHNPEITTEQYIVFSKSDAVKNTLFQGSRQTYSDGLIGLDQGGEEQFYASDAWKNFTAADSHDAQPQRQAPNTTVLGYSDSSIMEDFVMGLRELDEGNFFTAPGECMVSRDFADLNGLKLGDSFDLQDVNSTQVAPLHLTVCGIYLDITTPQPDGTDWAVNNRRNEILTSFSTLKEHSIEGLYVTAVYYLTSPDLASEFESYVRENGLNEIYHVNVDAASYNSIVKPVESLKNISTTFLVVILLAGGVILILLSMLGVRERKYEIGVLRAMGMQKSKVVFGLICESICVMVLCLCIGLGVGCVIAQPVSNAIMDGQADLVEQQPQPNFGDILSSTVGTNETVSALQEVEIILAPEGIVFIVMISLALGLLTNIAGIFYITRYEPMKILSERS
ncbi:MAG: ABC transporter permease [Lachnospiraceae bacterium]|nr:ABC transporter permease [Lachnospiraceae bacterium]